MNDTVREFLNTHRTTARWLDDIVDVLMSRRGVAHVKVIADDIVKSNKARDKDTVEQIVTRRVNDFCSDAADFDRDAAHDLFQRVEPATYRLRTYPERPNVIELVRIEFDETAMQSMWDRFRQLAKQKQPQQWQEANNERKLSAFIKWMAKDQNQAQYNELKKIYDELSNGDLDSLLTG
jgi:hypothetical protein